MDIFYSYHYAKKFRGISLRRHIRLPLPPPPPIYICAYTQQLLLYFTFPSTITLNGLNYQCDRQLKKFWLSLEISIFEIKEPFFQRLFLKVVLLIRIILRKSKGGYLGPAAPHIIFILFYLTLFERERILPIHQFTTRPLKQ